jgi:hypothetical protein
MDEEPRRPRIEGQLRTTATARPAPQPEAVKPRVSTLVTAQAAPYEGDTVQVRITARGHGQVSTGEQMGFERYGAGEVIDCPEESAFGLWKKNYVDPVDLTLADKWFQREQREKALGDRIDQAQRDMLETHDSRGLDRYAGEATRLGLRAP